MVVCESQVQGGVCKLATAHKPCMSARDSSVLMIVRAYMYAISASNCLGGAVVDRDDGTDDGDDRVNDCFYDVADNDHDDDNGDDGGDS